MAQVFKGFFTKLNEKHGGSGRKAWTLYSTKLQDENGKETDWISFGFDKPSLKEGDYVKITTEKDDKGYEKVSEVKKLKNPPARAEKVEKAAKAGTSVEAQDKQTSIHYQNSRTAAIAAVQLLVAHDALALPKAATKTGEAKRYAIIVAAIDKLTVQYFNDLETMRLLETVADAGVKDTKPDAPLPSEEKDEEEDDEKEEADDEEADEEEEEDEEDDE